MLASCRKNLILHNNLLTFLGWFSAEGRADVAAGGQARLPHLHNTTGTAQCACANKLVYVVFVCRQNCSSVFFHYRKIIASSSEHPKSEIFRVYFYKFYLFVNMYSNGFKCQLLITWAFFSNVSNSRVAQWVQFTFCVVYPLLKLAVCLCWADICGNTINICSAVIFMEAVLT